MCQLADEAAVSVFLTRGIAFVMKQKTKKYRATYIVDGVEVCDGFYQAIHRVSKGKMKTARQMTRTGVDMRVHGNERKIYVLERPVGDLCVLFWTNFFDIFCQVNPAGGRFFPVNKSYDDIFKDHLTPWWAIHASEHALPVQVGVYIGYSDPLMLYISALMCVVYCLLVCSYHVQPYVTHTSPLWPLALLVDFPPPRR